MKKGKGKVKTVKAKMAMNKEEYQRGIFNDFKRVWQWGHPMFYDLIIEMCKIHEVKNKSYGIGNPLGNFMECERFGIPAWKGALVRITDKVSRIYNLTAKMDNPAYADAFKMENLEDTLIDLANYSLLCLILLREAKKKPLYAKILEPVVASDECQACTEASG